MSADSRMDEGNIFGDNGEGEGMEDVSRGKEEVDEDDEVDYDTTHLIGHHLMMMNG